MGEMPLSNCLVPLLFLPLRYRASEALMCFLFRNTFVANRMMSASPSSEPKPAIVWESFTIPPTRCDHSVHVPASNGTLTWFCYHCDCVYAGRQFEVFDSDLSSFALFVYQFFPNTSFVHLTDKLTFVISNDPDPGENQHGEGAKVSHGP